MPCYNPGGGEVQISPTFLSSDLLTPGVHRRITFSSLGVFRRPNRATSWGTEETKYGGIGRLPVLSQAPAVVKDIVKSRTHRHYSSGLNNYNACSQPYAVTSLSLSGCRINDQLLPAPLDTEHEKLDEPWPGHAYTSHICRCDVFPRFDPERTKFDGIISSQRKLKKQLLPSTEDALEKLSYSIYSTSVYQEAIKDNKHSPNQSGEACEDNVVSIPNKENTSLIEVEDWEVKDQEEIEGKTENEEEQVEGNLKKGLPKNRHDNLEDDDAETQPHLSVVWPIWPVGLDDMRKKPLNFPKIPLPTYAPQDFTKISQMPSKETTQNIQGGSEEYSPKCGSLESTKYENWIRTASKYIPALTAYNSSSLDFGEMKHLRFSNPEHKNLNELGQVRVGLLPVKHLAGVDYVKLPLIPSKQTTERSHEPPQRKLHCTTEMLGIRFKTDAHKRYHEIYSDVIPDLRSSTITGRQHFFWGVHACTLR